MSVLANRVTIGDLHMDQLDLFTNDTFTSTNEAGQVTMTPLQFEIMQCIASGDMSRATELIELQNCDDDIWF